jgi:hypothetical protein
VNRRDAVSALASLERIGRRHGPGLAARKLALLRRLAGSRLRTARQVTRLHELMEYLDAFPDDRRVHAVVRRMLCVFSGRADLRRFRQALAGSGIAGTDTPYRFFWPTAHWISRCWPGALAIERDDADHARAILDVLPSLLDAPRAEWLRRQLKPTLAVFDRLRPRELGDADFLIGLVAALPWDEASREAFFDRVDPPFLLRSGRGTPERTNARFPTSSIHHGGGRSHEPRPDIRKEAMRTPRQVTALRGASAAALVRLARVSMITRERDLAVFQYPNARDAFLVDDGDGLAFAMIGAAVSRRALLPVTYAGLVLRNGVPMGYIQLDVLGRHASVSFNLFPAFRAGIAAWVFARLIAATHSVFGCDEFSIEPYQLGEDNEEGIDSGAWWFYHRQGFRPRSPATRRLAVQELARKAHRAGHRSSGRTLRALAAAPVFLSLDPARRASLPRTDEWLTAAVQALARFGDADPRRRQAVATRAAATRLGISSDKAAQCGLERWTGLVLALTSRGRWSRKELRGLARIIVSKCAASEKDFQRLLLRHRRLRTLLGC